MACQDTKCASCLEAARRDDNIDTARATWVDRLSCIECGNETSSTVATVQSARGAVRCARCAARGRGTRGKG